jgi:acyl dehydratase
VPGLGRIYARAAASALPGRRHNARSTGPVALSRELTVAASPLAAYTRVCGFRLGSALPPTYPHVLAFPLQMTLMTEPSFPFPVPGMVHIRNVITQHRPLAWDQPLQVSASVGTVAPHPRGAQVDLVSEVRLDGEVVWESRSTYLARGATAPTAAAPDAPARDDSMPATVAATWRVSADTGRRYAKVSGDMNPIHLHPLTARLFGFPRTIAHGMWAKARVLAALEGRIPGAFTADVDFRKPVTIPGTVRFTARPAQDGWDVGLWSSSARPHLLGSVRAA